MVDDSKLGLNHLHRGAVLALLVSVAAASQVAGNFADAAGFSGRNGVDCTACHTPAPAISVPAQAVLEGLPDAWDADATYSIRVAVTGGPSPLPGGPQGGFDIATDAGAFAVAPDQAGLLRAVGPQEVTYYPDGTLSRSWEVTWTAPGLDAEPVAATVWLAVLAANGNHNAQLNLSDGGERFDSAAALVRLLPPSDATLARWQAMPLAEPLLASAQARDGTLELTGRHADGNATHIAWRIGDAPWQERATGPAWRLALDAGSHDVAIRSAGSGRVSPELLVPAASPATAVQAEPREELSSSALLPLLLVAGLGALILRRPA